jgi:predicted dehydrogenase
MKKVAWGILSTANIGMARVIPAMQQSALCSIDAICSRSLDSARSAAQKAGIPRAYGSYEQLLADPSIEAIYNPLPNHLHVEWTIKAMQAGKHVLCEKPLGMNAADAARLISVRDATGRKVMEAFATRVHPQWLKVRELVQSGRIGELRAMQGFVSYVNLDPKNVRNRADIGGGGIMDVGCYLITMPRFVFGTEPSRVISLVQRDPEMHTDSLASCILDFPNGQASFGCSTQIARYQRMQFFGTLGRIELEIPVNAPPDRPCRIIVDDGRDMLGSGIEVIEIPTCNQYTIQGEVFSKAIREDSELPISLESSVLNMRVIDAIFRSEKSRQWEIP